MNSRMNSLTKILKENLTGKIAVTLCLLFFITNFAACSLSILPDSVSNQYYVIEKSEISSLAKRIPYNLRIRGALAGRLIDSPRILFSPETNRRGHYQYSSWVDSPAKRLTELLEEGFNDSKVFNRATKDFDISADFELRMKIKEFYHYTKNRPGEVRVSVSAELFNLDNSERVSSREFYLVKDAPSFDAEGAVQAFTEASNELVLEMRDWVVSYFKKDI